MITVLTHRLHHLYLLLALLFGVAFLLLTPPSQVPDESSHAAKIGFMYHGFYLGAPSDARIPNVIEPLQSTRYRPLSTDAARVTSLFDQRLDCESASSFTPRSAAAYSPLPYLLPTANLHVACAMGASQGYFIYGSRLLNLLLAATLTWLAIGALPFGKWAMMAVALLPMTLFQTASLSADSLTFAVSFLFIALVLRHATDGRPITGRQVLGLVAVSGCLALNKPGAIWLYPLFLLLWPAYRGRLGSFLGLGLVVIGLPGLVHLLFVSLATSPEYAVINRGVGANPTENLQLIIEQPVRFLGVLFDTYVSSNGRWLYASLVGNLGLLSIAPSPLLLVSATLAMLLSVVVNPPSALPTPQWPLRTLALTLSAAMLVILAVPLYLTWTPAGADIVHGLQGRYFIPVAALFLIGLSMPLPRQRLRVALSGLTLVCIVVSLTVATVALIRAYWLA